MSEEMNEFTPDLYTLVDEDGKEQVFEMLDAMEVEDQRYFALVPYQPEPTEMIDGDGDLVILKASMVDGEDMLISIDDDDEFEKIGQMFLKRIEAMFEDEDCLCDDDDCNCCHDDNCDCCH